MFYLISRWFHFLAVVREIVWPHSLILFCSLGKKAAISSTRISNALTTNSVKIIKESFYIVYIASKRPLRNSPSWNLWFCKGQIPKNTCTMVAGGKWDRFLIQSLIHFFSNVKASKLLYSKVSAKKKTWKWFSTVLHDRRLTRLEEWKLILIYAVLRTFCARFWNLISMHSVC